MEQGLVYEFVRSSLKCITDINAQRSLLKNSAVFAMKQTTPWNRPFGTAVGTVAGGAIGYAIDGVDGMWIGIVIGFTGGAGVGGIIGAGGAVLTSANSAAASKFISDLFAYTLTGTSFGTWEDYAVAFISGGLIKGLGMKGIVKNRIRCCSKTSD